MVHVSRDLPPNYLILITLSVSFNVKNPVPKSGDIIERIFYRKHAQWEMWEENFRRVGKGRGLKKKMSYSNEYEIHRMF